MEFNFDLLPLIFGLFWFIFVISIITRIGKAVKKAASSQGKGFDQQTVLSRLEELRKAMEEKERSAQEDRGQTSRTPAPSSGWLLPSAGKNRPKACDSTGQKVAL